jgi:hypothetical protein
VIVNTVKAFPSPGTDTCQITQINRQVRISRQNASRHNIRIKLWQNIRKCDRYPQEKKSKLHEHKCKQRVISRGYIGCPLSLRFQYCDILGNFGGQTRLSSVDHNIPFSDAVTVTQMYVGPSPLCSKVVINYFESTFLLVNGQYSDEVYMLI